MDNVYREMQRDNVYRENVYRVRNMGVMFRGAGV